MSWVDRVGSAMTEHSMLVIVLLVVLTAVLGAGVGAIEETASAGGLAEDSTVGEAYDTAQTEFTTQEANTTTTVVAVQTTDTNALSQDSLLRTLRYQRTLRTNETLNETLVGDQPTVGVANIVATVALGDELESRAEELQRALQEIAVAQTAVDRWVLAAERGQVDRATAQRRSTQSEQQIAATQATATSNLTDTQAAQFNESVRRVRQLTRKRSTLDRQYRQGEIPEEPYLERTADLDNRTESAYRNGTVDVFAEQFETLQATDSQPPIDEQIAALESLDDEAFSSTLKRVVDPDSRTAASRAVYRQLPQGYDPGSTTADARLIVVTQATEGAVRAPVAISESVSSGQVAARSLADEQSGPERYRVVSQGLVGPQQEQAITDSLSILGPLALLFILLSLAIAYRDPVDIVLGLVGIGIVLVWTFGAMGWLGIPFGLTMIAAPILLIGLSVDYAFHVMLRYREQRATQADDSGVRTAMARALTGVGPALVLVTATTAIGFLANRTSPLGGIRDFAAVTAIGITASLVVFGLFVPALKTELVTRLSHRGRETTPSPPGTAGRIRRLLSGGSTLARRAPVAVLVITLLVTAGGMYGATQVDVSASEELFMADEPPAWTDELPESVQPGEFFLKENRRYIQSTFQSPDQQGYVLVEGNVTDAETLQRVEAAERKARQSESTFVTSRGDPAVVTPLSAMRTTAERNETFNATFTAADTDGDGVPNRDLRAVYDAFYETAPTLAARTIHRLTVDDPGADEHQYTALRLRMAIDGEAERSTAVDVLTDAASEFDGTDGLRATATGTPVINRENTNRISTSMIESLVVTLVVIFGLLTLFFRLREGSGSLGFVTLLPVAVAVSWLLGTMALLGITISPVTSLVGSISVGLGVDYAIHVSKRFTEERAGGVDTETALRRTVTGTGGAMLSSAVTTAAGFGVLSFALLPGLRQFGFVLAVGIVYAFVATIYIQPTLLVLWEQYATGSEPAVVASDSVGDD
jgi:predicted RND superfamily exporter protein